MKPFPLRAVGTCAFSCMPQNSTSTFMLCTKSFYVVSPRVPTCFSCTLSLLQGCSVAESCQQNRCEDSEAVQILDSRNHLCVERGRESIRIAGLSLDVRSSEFWGASTANPNSPAGAVKSPDPRHRSKVRVLATKARSWIPAVDLSFRCFRNI